MTARVTLCRAGENGRCAVHGGVMRRGLCQTVSVLMEVRERRVAQYTKYGTNETLEDGTGPRVQWLVDTEPGWDAQTIEGGLRQGYERYERRKGAPTWMHLVREEVAEAFMEDDPGRLRDELLDVAALCVSWIEKLDNRAAARERRAD